MPKDMIRNRSDSAHGKADSEMQELRAAALILGRRLKDFGKSRVHAATVDLEEASGDLLTGGRELAQDVQRRLVRAERKVEDSLRAHPANWLAGIVGLLGAGLAISLILRNRE